MKLNGFVRHADGTILDFEGNELFLSLKRFLALIKDEKRCFLCGVNRDEAPFNDEHIVPDWVQRAYDLRNKTIQLPNGTKYRYPHYVIRCCVECNSFFGDEFERPISRAIRSEYHDFIEWYENNIFRVFLWMNLIYLKVHLKDNLLRLHRNLTKPDHRIGSIHDWSQLHHCHALLRAVKNNVPIEMETTLGSMFCLHLGEWAEIDKFDYKDHLPTQTMMIRLGSTAFIASLNDSQGVLQGLMPKLEKLRGDIDRVQLVELYTEFQFVNYHLKNRPSYGTIWDQKRNSFVIKGIIPDEFDLDELDFDLRRRMLRDNILAAIPDFRLAGLGHQESIEKLAAEDVTFLHQS